MSVRAIIIAAGEATRWGNYLGVPKHFIPIDGEPIIERTIRLLRERGVLDIHVVGPDDTRYRIPGSYHFIPKKEPSDGGLDKFLNSSELWSKDGRTLVVYGDVYFTDEAMDTIINYKDREWRLFCSFEKGECFVQSFYPEHIEKHYNALKAVVKLESEGGIRYVGGWSHYRYMCGVRETLEEQFHGDHGQCTVIDDLTDDFDCPNDYVTFMERMRK